MNIIITGPKHCGKSTVISKVIAGFSDNISGFITEFDNRESDSRKLMLHGICDSPGCCAVKWTEGAYELYPDVFNSYAPNLIDPESKLIVIDELGKFEKECKGLEIVVTAAFSSSANVLASVRLDAVGWMQELKSRSDTRVINVDQKNRDTLPGFILSLMTDNGKL